MSKVLEFLRAAFAKKSPKTERGPMCRTCANDKPAELYRLLSLNGDYKCAECGVPFRVEFVPSAHG